MHLTTIILTFNEEKHIARAIDSAAEISRRIFVIDSGSTDGTLEIAKKKGAEVFIHDFVNQSRQFNWALEYIPIDTDWVLRLDADEVVTNNLAREIKNRLPRLPESVAGVYLYRRMTFVGRPIRWGGVFPVRVLRIFRHGRGQCENRWMDEHIKVFGSTVDFEGDIIDNNLNSLTWWTDKHNKYASRDAVDLLNLEYGFMPHDSVAQLRGESQAGFKRWLKERVYHRLPGGFRAFAYFFYRYVIRLGFLDGQAGTAFHFLQGFWYRYLVDAKVAEVKRYMRANDAHVVVAIERVLGIKV